MYAKHAKVLISYHLSAQWLSLAKQPSISHRNINASCHCCGWFEGQLHFSLAPRRPQLQHSNIHPYISTAHTCLFQIWYVQSLQSQFLYTDSHKRRLKYQIRRGSAVGHPTRPRQEKTRQSAQRRQQQQQQGNQSQQRGRKSKTQKAYLTKGQRNEDDRRR